MDRTFASATLNSDPLARDLIEYLGTVERETGIEDAVLYYQFPLFRDSNDELHSAHVLLASRRHGIVIFGPVARANSAITGADDRLSQLLSIVFGKCLQSRQLRKSQRELKFPLVGVLVRDLDQLDHDHSVETENKTITSFAAVADELSAIQMPHEVDEDTWSELRAVIEGTKAIIRPKPREIPPSQQNQPGSKVAILAKLEGEIANFDANQRKAAITIVDGPQRIRGLAGTGKTVVLAMKAAHIHLMAPEADILVTFYTKSLYDFIRRLITRFYRQFNDHDPDWTKVHVRHAWGGRSMEGVYYSAATENGYEPITLRSAAAKTDPFNFVCRDLLRKGSLGQVYDYVLMDEAQDFPASFYQLCFRLTKGGEFDRNVIWAYDELQNIMNVNVTAPVELFGTNSSGVPLMDLDRAGRASQTMNHDIVLYKSYRNPREILICAHALGFGIYGETMVQTLENKAHWEDLGYVVETGEIEVGDTVIVSRAETNSPLTISSQQTPSEIIKTFVANSIDAEVSWVASEIRSLITEGLNANDIIVVSLDDRNARNYFKRLSEALDGFDIRTNNLLADPYSAPHFSIADHVTLSTVYRAKGNEAAVVFAVGVDALFYSRKEQRARNKLFTAFTRAKAWLRVSGLGAEAQAFVHEIEAAIQHIPRMEFTQPDPKDILILQRDLSDRSSKMRKLQEEFDKRLQEMEIDPEEREAFLSSLRKKK